jgi:pentatricopeptide repeat protein
MNQAGEYYRNGEFDKAIGIYEELRNEGYEGTSTESEDWVTLY